MYNPYQYQYQQPAPNNSYSFVNGIEGAKSFLMQPNQTVLLMDSDAPVCYMKTSNQFGQSTLRYFKLHETSETELRGLSQQTQTQNENYATKTELKDILDRLSKLEGKENE